MLRGISPLLSPDLLAVLSRMGHGDDLVLTDAHFPADAMNARVIRADGLMVDALLDAILPLWELDSYVASPVTMMAAAEGDELDQQVLARFRSAIERHHPQTSPTEFIGRFDFYDRTRAAFAVVITGETAKYANVIIKKGVILAN
ncbi:L-fucose mutarotase [Consotaella aegiceratis]|uniref:L-fucose mutarotase n=1 Tax=Consotaella aegiceratis TaxID=3097961 RepID=UPI002F3FEB70